eukprot:Skav223979  [mRNA]  locus=scaffold1107:330082:331695:- [translate_table: standard]
MSVRKNRSKQFLCSEFAHFSICLVLVFHHLLGNITKVGFKLHDSDKVGIPNGVDTVRRKRARLRGKQSVSLQLPPLDERQYSMLDYFSVSLDTIDLLWDNVLSNEVFSKTMFGVAEAFWPAGHPRASMLERICSDALQSIAALKWRVITRAMAPPYNLLHMCQPECPAEILEKRYRSFMGLPDCCLDAGWSTPVQGDVLQQEEESDRIQRLRFHVQNFLENGRGVSSREECQHATQRKFANGFASLPTTFPSQVAHMTLKASLEHFSSRAGKTVSQVQGIPQQIKRQVRNVRQDRVIHKRPRQYGSAMFLYINAQRRDGVRTSVQELRQQWKELAPAAKESWARKHRLKVASRRIQIQQTQAHLEERARAERTPQTPWGIGDARWPLKEEHVEKFLSPFRSKVTGLQAMQESNAQEVADLRSEYGSGILKYNSMDAAYACAKASFGPMIDDDLVSGCGLWKEMLATPKLKRTCLDNHPGLCSTVDQAILSGVQALVAAFPNKNGLVLVELGSRLPDQRAHVFVRVVTGLRWLLLCVC